MNLNCLMLLSAGLVFATATQAETTVNVRVVAFDNPDHGVRSTVTLERGGDSATARTDPEGHVRFVVEVCGATVNLWAKPKLPYIRTAAYECGTPLVIRARKVVYASSITRALNEVPTGFQGDSESPYELAESLAAALEEDAFAEAADAAFRLSSLSPDDPELARSFETLAADLGFRALGLEPGGEETPLIIAGDQTGLLTPLGADMLQQFQSEAGLPTTSEWDYRTIDLLGRLE